MQRWLWHETCHPSLQWQIWKIPPCNKSIWRISPCKSACVEYFSLQWKTCGESLPAMKNKWRIPLYNEKYVKHPSQQWKYMENLSLQWKIWKIPSCDEKYMENPSLQWKLCGGWCWSFLQKLAMFMILLMLYLLVCNISWLSMHPLMMKTRKMIMMITRVWLCVIMCDYDDQYNNGKP